MLHCHLGCTAWADVSVSNMGTCDARVCSDLQLSSRVPWSLALLWKVDRNVRFTRRGLRVFSVREVHYVRSISPFKSSWLRCLWNDFNYFECLNNGWHLEAAVSKRHQTILTYGLDWIGFLSCGVGLRHCRRWPLSRLLETAPGDFYTLLT